MEIPRHLRFNKSHEWVKLDADTAVIGISAHAQDSLGDITFVELPQKGDTLSQGEEFGVIESVKAANDLYAPVSGTVEEVNTALEDTPELVNTSPYEDGWLVKLTGVDAAELDALMDASAYETFLESEA
jgi:glycine cleavage system H protein